MPFAFARIRTGTNTTRLIAVVVGDAAIAFVHLAVAASVARGATALDSGFLTRSAV